MVSFTSFIATIALISQVTAIPLATRSAIESHLAFGTSTTPTQNLASVVIGDVSNVLAQSSQLIHNLQKAALSADLAAIYLTHAVSETEKAAAQVVVDVTNAARIIALNAVAADQLIAK